MAGRILNRRELREQADQAEQAEQVQAAGVEPGAGADGAGTEVLAGVPAKKRKRVAKTPAAPRAKRVRKVKTPPRMFARWGIFDASLKQVAIFDYNQRAAADERLAQLLLNKKGIHFLQMVKEAMPEAAAEAEAAAAAALLVGGA